MRKILDVKINKIEKLIENNERGVLKKTPLFVDFLVKGRLD